MSKLTSGFCDNPWAVISLFLVVTLMLLQATTALQAYSAAYTLSDSAEAWYI